MTRSLRGLDWLNFFVANFQTGFGPFIAVYLTGVGWTQGAIGAVLSAGTATCAQVDPSRIRVDWVGTDQTSEPRPGICGTSAHAAQQERTGSGTSAADHDRRVEVYLVPRGTTAMPPAVKEIKPLPAAQVKALGCPK